MAPRVFLCDKGRRVIDRKGDALIGLERWLCFVLRAKDLHNYKLMKTILRLFLTAIISWLVGLTAIAASLYFRNGGADFTHQDLMGFGLLVIFVSGVLMVAVYAPGLLLLKRHRKGCKPRVLFPLVSGTILNLPIFLILALLIGRKMAASEALLFMFTFLLIGLLFGLGFVWSQADHRISQKQQL